MLPSIIGYFEYHIAVNKNLINLKLQFKPNLMIRRGKKGFNEF